MENRKTEKNINLGDKVYQIKKMDPRSACWLFSFLGTRAEGGLILSALGKCSRIEFAEIQAMSLRQIYRLDSADGNVLPIAILSNDGSFSDPFLSDDAESVYKLTCESILFNLDPFLVVSGSKSPQ
jgi:hypothetical protein